MTQEILLTICRVSYIPERPSIKEIASGLKIMFLLESEYKEWRWIGSHAIRLACKQMLLSDLN